MIAAAVLLSLRVGGLDPATLAVGGAITAVVFGLAAQQTLGNLIAGIVLIAARPFRVGDRVRLQAGGLAGQIEGVVGSLGLLYTTLRAGPGLDHGPEQHRAQRRRRAAARARRGRPARPAAPDVRPSAVQALLEDAIQTPVRGEPRIALEELDADEVVVRVTGDAGGRRRRPAARGRDPRRPRRGHARGARTSAWRPRARRACRAGRAPSRRPPWRRRAGAAPVPTSSGASPPNAAPARRPSGATSISARLRSIARSTAARRPRACLVPTNARQLHARVVEHARVADEAREHDRDADAAGAQVLAQPEREPAQAELRRRVDRAAAARRPCPTARR